MNIISFHRRNLPHYYRPNSTYFITFRVKGSIPQKQLQILKKKYEQLRVRQIDNDASINDNYFYEYDSALHQFELTKYFHNKKFSLILNNELHKYDGKDYKLLSYSIMPNHVHLIFHLLDNARSISKIMQEIKRITAYRINLVLGKKGNFWQAESYDHIVRDMDELEILIEYTLMNPVKAGIVDDWKEFEHNYLSDSW